MSAIVVDTDVISFLFKRDRRAFLYQRHLTGQTLVISFMTLAELERWALQRNWGAARLARRDRFLRQFVLHSVDPALCRKWAEASDSGRRGGRPIETADAWIAATALLYGIPLVTHNRNDYLGVSGLTILSEAAP